MRRRSEGIGVERWGSTSYRRRLDLRPLGTGGGSALSGANVLHLPLWCQASFSSLVPPLWCGAPLWCQASFRIARGLAGRRRGPPVARSGTPPFRPSPLGRVHQPPVIAEAVTVWRLREDIAGVTGSAHEGAPQPRKIRRASRAPPAAASAGCRLGTPGRPAPATATRPLPLGGLLMLAGGTPVSAQRTDEGARERALKPNL